MLGTGIAIFIFAIIMWIQEDIAKARMRKTFKMIKHCIELEYSRRNKLILKEQIDERS